MFNYMTFRRKHSRKSWGLKTRQRVLFLYNERMILKRKNREPGLNPN